MKLSKLLLIIVIALFFLKLGLEIVKVPLGEVDNAHNIAAYNKIAEKGGALKTSDFLIQFDDSFVINRTGGTYGIPAAYILLVNYDFNIRLPYLIIGCFVVIASVTLYKLYNRKNMAGMVVLAYSLLNPRMAASLLWGQWAFLISLAFSVIGVLFFEKFLKSFSRSDFLFAFISLFLVLQVHQLTIIVALSGIAAILFDKFMNRQLTLSDIKYVLLMGGLLVLSQLPFIGYYHSLFGTFSDTVNFNLTEAFLVNYTNYGYPWWYFHDYPIVWNVGLVLVPLGIIYSLKQKKYTYIVWFVLLWIFSRHSLVPFTHEQSRLSVSVPFIGALLCGEGIMLLRKYEKLFFSLSLVVVIVLFFLLKPIGHISSSFTDVLDWVRENLPQARLTTCFPIPQSAVWSFSSITNRKFFAPRYTNHSLLLTNYTDLQGVYNITHIICYKHRLLKRTIYDNGEYVVIPV